MTTAGTALRLLGLAMVLMVVIAPLAGAQSGPSLEVDPAEAVGGSPQAFTVRGAGWTSAAPVFVVPCNATSLEELASTSANACDTADLTEAMPIDGAFEVTVTIDVPADGLCFAATDAGQTETAGVCVLVVTEPGSGDDGADPGDGDGDGDGDADGDDALAHSGSETTMVLIGALALMATGTMCTLAAARVRRTR